MSLFGKKGEVADEDYEDEELTEKAPPKKSFKDLKPENRKKRKEPPKPWGKKERTLVLATLLVTVLAAVILSSATLGFSWPQFNGLSWPKFNGQKATITIVGTKEQREKAETIKKLFSQETINLKGTYAFYVIDLANGFGFGDKEEEVFPAASLNKLPVLATIFTQVEAGRLDLNQTHALTLFDKQPGAGTLAQKPTGTVITLTELARLMGNGSDNTALFIATNEVGGGQNIERVGKEIGMDKTSFGEGTTTPKDIGLFFKKLYRDEIVSAKYSDQILGFLTNTVREDLIPDGVPKGVRVAHKYGTIDAVVNDAGIIFALKPYVLVIMSKDASSDEAQKVIPEISQMVYGEMNK